MTGKNRGLAGPVDQLKQPLRACLSGDGERHQLSLEATNRRGKPIQCQVTCTPLLGGNQQIQGAIVLMEGLELG